MNTYRIETELTAEGTVMLRDLPFVPGTSVEVIIRERTSDNQADEPDGEHAADWLKASKRSLQEVWDNVEDAVYDTL